MRWSALVRQPLLLLWTALVLVPFVFIFLLSFRSTLDIYAHPLGGGGNGLITSNYVAAWEGSLGSSGFSTYFLNSTIVAVTALAVSLATGSMSAYFISTLAPATRRVLVRIFLLGSVLPIVLLLVPYFQLYNALGLLNNPVALGVLYAALTLPTTVLILHSFFIDFPIELREAATIDGLSQLAIFARVVLPLSKGALTAVGMLSGIFIWGETQVAITLLQDSTTQTVPLGMLSFKGVFFSDQGPLFAGLALASLPVIIAYLFLNRFVSKGIALGGVFR